MEHDLRFDPNINKVLDQYKKNILSTAINPETGVLQIEFYAQAMQSPKNTQLKSELDKLISHPALDIYRDESSRKLNAYRWDQLLTIFHGQFSYPPAENKTNATTKADAALLNALIGYGTELPFTSNFIEQSTNTFTSAVTQSFTTPLGKITEHEVELYGNTLLPIKADDVLIDDKQIKLYKKFMAWFEKLETRDIGEINELLDNRISVLMSFYNRKIKAQNDSNLKLKSNYPSISLNTAGLGQVHLLKAPDCRLCSANVCLDDEEFHVADAVGVLRPLLHFAMKAYADAPQNSQQKENAFICVELLIQRGCSPFTENKEVRNHTSQTAFIYANIPTDSKVLACFLRFTIAYTPLTEKLRVELFQYCENTVKELNSWTWWFFNSLELKNQRLKQVTAIIIGLLKAGETAANSDLWKILEESQKTISTYSSGSKLLGLLGRTLINQNDYLGNTIPNIDIESDIKLFNSPSSINQAKVAVCSLQKISLARVSMFYHINKGHSEGTKAADTIASRPIMSNG
jgi:hypothetical protein